MAQRPVTHEQASAGRATPAPRPRTSRWAVGAGVATVFVAGLVIGGAVVTVTGISAKQSVEIVPSPSPVTPTAPQPTGPTQAQIAIGQDCVKAIDQVQTLYQEFQQAGAAASHLNLADLDRLVQQMQQVEGSLNTNLSSCRATIRLPSAAASASAG